MDNLPEIHFKLAWIWKPCCRHETRMADQPHGQDLPQNLPVAGAGCDPRAAGRRLFTSCWPPLLQTASTAGVPFLSRTDKFLAPSKPERIREFVGLQLPAYQGSTSPGGHQRQGQIAPSSRWRHDQLLSAAQGAPACAEAKKNSLRAPTASVLSGALFAPLLPCTIPAGHHWLCETDLSPTSTHPAAPRGAPSVAWAIMHTRWQRGHQAKAERRLRRLHQIKKENGKNCAAGVSADDRAGPSW